MPYLDKQTFSQYIGSGCKRQLRLNLSPDNQNYRAERQVQNMPPRQPPRPGLEQFTQAGEAWQAEKLHDLTVTFGASAIVGAPYLHALSGQTRYHNIRLDTALAQVSPNQFIIEADYSVIQSFENALNIQYLRTQYNLAYAALRPDIIEVLPTGTFTNAVTPDGTIVALAHDDVRQQLRIIDIKLTAKPSPSYFAQVTYYMMVLAGWLEDNGLDQQFVVVREGALWPGSHDASNLVRVHQEFIQQHIQPTIQDLSQAITQDLELVPFEVMAARLRRFLQHDIAEVLSQPWQDLEWHVDNRCSGCDYLGYPWNDRFGQPTWNAAHCMPTAATNGSLCRLAFMSKGASNSLHSTGVNDVTTLAGYPATDPAFDTHQSLRAQRTVISSRAQSLLTSQSSVAPNSGTSATMPKWADLRVYITVDFDIGSAITFALGLHAFWRQPTPYGQQGFQPASQQWGPTIRVVDQRSIQAERRELLNFLRDIENILTFVSNQDQQAQRNAQTAQQKSTVQFYIWDSLQYDHFTRIIGRHLDAILNDSNTFRLAWLFPPEELLANAEMATRRSPVTIVKDAVRSVLAVPVPHYYSLLEVARRYYHSSLPAHLATFEVHVLFEDLLSDQIPSERAHEIWTRSANPPYSQQIATLLRVEGTRLRALETITRRLEDDLRPLLGKNAPQISVGPPIRRPGLSFDGQLWYAFARLDNALAELEVHTIRSMPPHEREARFHSVRLTHRLTGQEEEIVLQRLGLPIPSPLGRRVYAMRSTSNEVRMRDGDFNVAIGPEQQTGWLDQNLLRTIENTPLHLQFNPTDHWQVRLRMEDVTGITIVTLDRDNLAVVIDPNTRWPTMLDDLEQQAGVNLTTDVILDPVHHDYFTSKLLAALHAVGNPARATTAPTVRRAVGQMRGRGANQTPDTPIAELLWSAATLHNTQVQRNLSPIQAALIQCGLNLNAAQWRAWEAALTRKMQLIWGPPGTGKSRTARAIVAGAALEANQSNRRMRILVCASTYTAMDNVLLPVCQNDVPVLLQNADYQAYRLRSYLQRPPTDPVLLQIDVAVNKHNPSPQMIALRGRLLTEGSGVTIIGATPEQIQNLMTVNHGQAQEELFDLILIDEASQMDVAHSILPLCALSNGGSVVLAGDPKQLPPIHQAEPPAGLENRVGSVYSYFKEVHGVGEEMLEENYRSNSTIVNFAHRADYRPTLHSYSPNLRLNLISSLPTVQPITWQQDLYWTPEWASLLDPALPTVCFIYSDGRSSQSNVFEADAVSALVWMLWGRIADQPLNERDPLTGTIIPTTINPYSSTGFWENAVGIVTPHRAQQGLIVSRLHRMFGSSVPPNTIRDAVDTVERFQGQQRDVIIASYALGDPDEIAQEDEFLMSLNRFNVMTSRARTKLIVLVSQEVINHLSSDLDVLRDSRLVKVYTEEYCHNTRPMELGLIEGNIPRSVPGVPMCQYRVRQSTPSPFSFC